MLHAGVHPANDLVGLLDEPARVRAAAIRNPRLRDAHVTAQALLRVVMASRVGLLPADVVVDRTCGRCGGDHGKPRVVGTDLDLSLTHAAGMVLLAVSPGPRLQVGVDAEPRPGLPAIPDTEADEVLAREVLGPEEQEEWRALPPEERGPALTRWWTRKEAVLKAHGLGLAVPPRSVRVSPPGEPPRLLAWDRSLAGAVLTTPVALADLDLPRVCGTAAALGVASLEAELENADPLLSAVGCGRW